MPERADESFSPLEIGLLTVAERRGVVRTPRIVDQRNDPASIERLIVLRRLAGRGLLAEQPGDAAEVEFVITQAGQAALAAADRAPGQPQGRRPTP
jgi:hypothetical protein